jgi:hypothetical protein
MGGVVNGAKCTKAKKGTKGKKKGHRLSGQMTQHDEF